MISSFQLTRPTKLTDAPKGTNDTNITTFAAFVFLVDECITDPGFNFNLFHIAQSSGKRD
jgi:hypothetical protein